MKDRDAYSWVIFVARMKNRELRKRWGEEMPDIAKGEYDKNTEMIAWAEYQLEVEQEIQNDQY